MPLLPLVVAAFGLLWLLEGRCPLRRITQPRLVRLGRNLGLAALGAAAMQVADRPLTAPLARLVESRRWGLLPRVPLPAAARMVAALLLLDYTIYLWHVLLHRVPALWRFHVVHHADRDLDSSTALRFHFGELLASVPFRAAQIAVLGVGPQALALWHSAFFLSVLFHHSNLRLPESLERRLLWVMVTPRMHGIHHSTVQQEADSNWSSGLSLWDRIHGTLRLDVAQDAVTIGVPAYRRAEELSLERLVALPFGEQRPSWTAEP
jgi:sterol desaturase/sphingolipid hydroxylase (fatty acid hydroxylase superfamily)